MAYPKRTDFEKQTFIAKVFILLKTKGKLVQYNNLDKETDLNKKYESALRYSREMGYKYEGVLGLDEPQTDLAILSAPTDGTEETTELAELSEVPTTKETTEETKESDFTFNSMTAEEVQERIQNHRCNSLYKQKQQNTIKQQKSERRKMLLEKHYEVLDWLQSIDDGIVKGDYFEAKKMIALFNSYAERLQNMLDKVYVERAQKVLKQLAELQTVLGKEGIKKINESIGAYVPITE